MPDLRTICCSACAGDGRFEVWTGYDPRDGSATGYYQECSACDGTGGEIVQAHPVELDDLEFLSA